MQVKEINTISAHQDRSAHQVNSDTDGEGSFQSFFEVAQAGIAQSGRAHPRDGSNHHQDRIEKDNADHSRADTPLADEGCDEISSITPEVIDENIVSDDDSEPVFSDDTSDSSKKENEDVPSDDSDVAEVPENIGADNLTNCIMANDLSLIADAETVVEQVVPDSSLDSAVEPKPVPQPKPMKIQMPPQEVTIKPAPQTPSAGMLEQVDAVEKPVAMINITESLEDEVVLSADKAPEQKEPVKIIKAAPSQLPPNAETPELQKQPFEPTDSVTLSEAQVPVNTKPKENQNENQTEPMVSSNHTEQKDSSEPSKVTAVFTIDRQNQTNQDGNNNSHSQIDKIADSLLSSPAKTTEVQNAFDIAQESRPRTVDMQENVDKVVKAARAAVSRNSSVVQLRLEPPELGTLRIEIRHNSNGLNLQFQATNSTAQQLLQQHSHELRSALEAHGLQANQIDIQLRTDLRNEAPTPQNQQQQQTFDYNGRHSGQQYRQYREQPSSDANEPQEEISSGYAQESFVPAWQSQTETDDLSRRWRNMDFVSLDLNA